MPTTLTIVPTVTIGGQALDPAASLLLAEVRVERSVHTGAKALLRFTDPDYELFDGMLAQVGTGVKIDISSDDSREQVFSGSVTGVGVEHDPRDEALPVLRIEARDDAHRLAVSSTFKAYLGQSVRDIVTEVAGRHDLRAEVEDMPVSDPYLLQSGTDHAFLSYLAAQFGSEWFVADGTLHFRQRPDPDGSQPEVDAADGSLKRFSANYSDLAMAPNVEVRGWDPVQQEPVVGDADRVLHSTTQSSVLGSDAPFAGSERVKGEQRVAGETVLAVATTAVRSQNEAVALAEAIGRELIGAGLTIEGVARGNADIDAGSFVTVKGVGRRLSGSYYVTEVVHEFGGSELTTRFLSSGHQRQRPEASGLWPGSRDGWGHFGLMNAIVTNVSDPEDLGRVKVQYPALGDTVESDWARLVMPGAGSDRGLDVRPEVGDEVVVGFEHADPRFAFVLGGVWSSDKPPADRPAVADDGSVIRRSFTSRTGHRVTLSDGDGQAREGDAERHIEIALADGSTKVLIGEDGIVIETPDGNPLALKSGGSSLTITDKGELVIKAKSVDIQADETATFRGDDVKVKATGSAEIDGGRDLKVKGIQVAVEASGNATLKGAMVKIN